MTGEWRLCVCFRGLAGRHFTSRLVPEGALSDPSEALEQAFSVAKALVVAPCATSSKFDNWCQVRSRAGECETVRNRISAFAGASQHKLRCSSHDQETENISAVRVHGHHKSASPNEIDLRRNSAYLIYL